MEYTGRGWGEREVDHKRKRGGGSEELSEWEKYIIKLAAATISPSLATLVSRRLPDPKEILFRASGIIVDCCPLSSESPPPRYLCTILAPASLLDQTCPTPTPLDRIQIDVSVSTGEVLHKGNLLAFDFHYNLAAITILSDIPLPTATLKPIDDVISIDPLSHSPILPSINPRHLHFPTSTPSPFHRSNLFKISPGSPIFSVFRYNTHPYSVISATGSFCSRPPYELRSRSSNQSRCGELYNIKHSNNPGFDGEPVINPLGEVIGIIFSRTSFLPANVVLRWWNHYKSFGKFRRPFIGMEVTNLYDADVDFLSIFITKFPNISTAIIVAKVMEDTPAFQSEIRANDVIVSLDGKLVRSKLEFYETIWEKAGKAVDAKVLRVGDGEELKLNIVIEEASENQFHKWPHPDWEKVW